MDRSHTSTDNGEVSSTSTMPDSAKSGNKTYTLKPGRKFGLTGQRHNHQQQVFVNSFTSGGSTADGRRMSVREEQRNSWMYSLSEQEMEDKYNAICLAIRTENLTLGQRLEHQHAERDLVENNLSQEVRVLHSLFLTLKQEVARSQASPYRDGLSSVGWNEIFIKVANQLDAVHSSATRISSSAESLGAVEYEARLSAAVQVLILYVDHIKRKWEKEHHELEETKRILKESGVNVAQCLAALPDRLGASANPQPSGPVSKRRASFPAAPFRRISLKPPPLVLGNARLSTTLSDPSANNDCVSATVPIAEEREDAAESDHPPPSASSIKTGDHCQQEAGKTALTPSQSPAYLPSAQSALATPSASTASSANVPSAPGVSVTIRRRGVGGLKSHSWSSGHTTSGLLDRRESAEASGRLVGAKTSWFSKAGQWTRLQLKQWRKTAATYTSSYAEQWTSLRQKRLQLLRYSASACFLLAALVSIVVTFVPSSGTPSPYNATVMPGHRTGR
ncbi:inositol 1,4,5-triphosphate receptor associated 2-like [Daphnia carinata]|uniref:inositol 1,4,5-triphosphate receptor associated 2-like n=1 Tax=Daphnia carinata TaxID=120202 RepID=UPI002580DFF2|nr:inositol 1,4,5-triphosphate receptor associated 2-like [Daphnia carinata]